MPQTGPKMAFLAESLNLATYWAFSQARKLKIENGFLRCDQHLELQVLSTHMPYFKEIYFSPLFRAQPFKYALSAVVTFS